MAAWAAAVVRVIRAVRHHVVRIGVRGSEIFGAISVGNSTRHRRERIDTVRNHLLPIVVVWHIPAYGTLGVGWLMPMMPWMTPSIVLAAVVLGSIPAAPIVIVFGWIAHWRN